MAKIANVALTNTFDTWRSRSNEAFDRLSQFAINNSSLYANTLTANVSFTSKGLATMQGRATVGTNLTVSGNTTTNKATVTSALTVSGNTTLGAANKTTGITGLLSITGRQTIDNNLTVSGNTNFGGASKTLTFGGAGATANMTGWFGVTGRQSISTNLFVGGNTVVMGTASGFGTTSPTYRIHISGSTTAHRILGIESTSTTGASPPILAFLRQTTTTSTTDLQGAIQWSRTLTDSTTITGSIQALGSNDSAAPSMSFYYNPYTSHVFQVNATEKVKITNGGLHITANTTLNGTTIDQSNALSQTLTDGVTINWDVALGRVATVTLGAAGRTMAAPTNLKVGTYILRVYQDATGSRTITTWNSVFKWTAAVAPVLSTGANKLDIITFFSDGTNLYGSYLPDMR